MKKFLFSAGRGSYALFTKSILFLTVLCSAGVWGQANLPFAYDGGKTSLPIGMTQSGLDTDYTTSPRLKFDSTGDYVIINFLSSPNLLSFNLKGNPSSGSTTLGQFDIQQSVDGTTYTTVASISNKDNNTASHSYILSVASRYVKFIYTTKTQGNIALGLIEISTIVPTINVSSTINNLDYIAGSGPSAPKTFTVSGSNLTTNINVAAPANFEISTASNGIYSSNLTLTPTSGTVASTTLYARLAAGLTVNSYSGNITASSTGGSSKTVAVSGTVSRATITSAQTGPWSQTSTWSGGVVPTSSNNAVIANGHAVTMDSDTFATRDSGTTTTVDSGGTLATAVSYINNGSTTVNGSFQLNAGGWVSDAVGTNPLVYGSSGTLIFNSTYTANSGNYWPTTNGPVNVTVNSGSPLTLQFSRTVTGTFQTAAGVLFPSANLTLNGSAQINTGGYFGNSPIYGSSSTLIYNTGTSNGAYGRASEWTRETGSIGSTPGFPNNVQLINNSILDYPNTGGSPFSTPLGIAGNLIIESGSALYMDYNGGGTKSGRLTVGKNVTIDGNLSLGDADGGDLHIGGNWVRTGTFNPKSRAVFFNGTSPQTISGATTFDYLTINNAAGVTLASPVTNNLTLDFANGKLALGNNDLTIASAGTITNATSTKYVVTNGTGQLKRTLAASSVLFPIGPSATAYNPISASNTGTSDVYGFRVVTGVAAAPDITEMVNNSWFASEATAGGGNLRVAPQWNVADQGTNFSGGFNFIELFTPAVVSLPAAVAGQTATLSNAGDNFTNPLNGTKYFAVAKHGPPLITSPLTATVALTVPFSYTITATNSPTSFNANNLPAGLSINTTTGMISGITTAATGTYHVTISATNIRGTGSATLVITVKEAPCFEEDFSAITAGNNTTTGGSGTIWDGNAKFPTVSTAYKAGGAVRLGSGSSIGSITSATLAGVAGDISVSVDVKGWTTVEGQLKVTVGTSSQAVSYTAKMGDSFETKVFTFTGVPLGSKLTIETTAGRAFIDNVLLLCTPIPPTFYRSTDSGGDWNNASSWQTSPDNITWSAAAVAPTSNTATSITIRNGQKITISTAGVSMTNTVVQNGGILEVTTTSSFDVSGDNEIELTIENGGQFLVNSPSTYAYPTGNAYGLIHPGGKLVAGPNMGRGTGTDFSNAYLGRINGLFYFGDQAICEWASPHTVLGSSSPTDHDFFYPYIAGDMPIFRISTTPSFSFGSGTSNIFYAVLEANANFSLTSAGTKTFTGGIRGTATVTQNPTSGNYLILGDGSNVPTIGGSVVLNVVTAKLKLPNGANVPLGATPVIMSSAENNSFDREGGNLTIDGTLDITNMRITNTASGDIIVNGTLRTSNTGGLTAGGAVPSGALTLNNGSTIDYYATLNQTISTAPNYYNITFSGAGTKSYSGTINVNTDGLVKITGTTTVDATGNLAFTDANNTAFTMDGGRLILRTTGAQPNMRGTYNLTGGTVEFANSSLTGQTIRSKAFQNIEVTGNNVGNSNGNITLNDSGTFSVKNGGVFTINSNAIVGPVGEQVFTVENGGVFKTGDADGFSGATSTSVRNDIETISLSAGSTIEYSRAGDQTITNATVAFPADANYQNFRISGSGVKTATGTITVNEKTLVDAGTLEIPATLDAALPNVITSKKGITVQTGGIFNLNNNAQLLQDADAVNSGSITARREISIKDNNQYNYLISPLIGSNLKTNVYENQTTGALSSSVFTLYHNETNNNFFSSTGAYILGRALAVKEPAATVAPAGGKINAIFTGAPMNGAFTYTLANSGNTATGYNLIGNPYPSNIDLDLLYNLNTNKEKISATIYFWDNLVNTKTTQEGSSYNGAAYAVFNAAAGTTGTGLAAGNLIGEIDGSKEPTRIVKPGQGFMVRSLSTTNRTIDFDNTIRLPDPGDVFFGKETTVDDRFYLKLSAPDNITTQTAVVYFGEGNSAFANDDSELNGAPSDVLYTLIGDKKAIINGRAPFTDTDVIKLGTKHFAAGLHTLMLGRKEGVFTTQSVYLKDNQTGAVTNLSEGAYMFTAQAGESTGRFEIVYKPGTVLATDASVKESVRVYRDQNNFHVKSPTKKITALQLFDSIGRMIYSAVPNATEAVIDGNALPNGVYILKVVRDGETLTKKILR